MVKTNELMMVYGGRFYFLYIIRKEKINKKKKKDEK